MTALQDLLKVAARQEGVFSRAQSIAFGVPSATRCHRVSSGRWEEVFSGVYRTAGTHETWRQRAMAGCLWAGAGSGASHTTAAWLWELDGLGRDPPQELHVLAPHETQRSTRGVTLHRTRSMPDGTWNFNGRIPLTNLARTLIDLSSCLDEEALELALDSACRKKKGLLAWLQQSLSTLGSQGREGAGVLAELIRMRSGSRAHDSALEVKVSRALRRAGLPEPRRQVRINDQHGRFIGEFDFVWPHANLVLESDGWGFHGNRVAWEKDHERRNRLGVIGITMLNVTWKTFREGTWLDRVRYRLGEAGALHR